METKQGQKLLIDACMSNTSHMILIFSFTDIIIRFLLLFLVVYIFRRRWKQIVENYIKSPHAESMRKRNWYTILSLDLIQLFG